MPKTTKEIILETSGFYSADPVGRRAVVIDKDIKQFCHYSLPDGRHCGVGRCLINKNETAMSSVLMLIVKQLGIPEGDIDADGSQLDPLLEEEYRGHSLKFWMSIQSFHDSDSHWTETGLSERGQKEVEFLIAHY